MVTYALKQAPEITLSVPGKNSSKAKEKAMSQLVERMGEDEGLAKKLADGASYDDLVEVSETAETEVDTQQKDDIQTLVQAVVSYGTLRVKIQQERSEALEVFQLIEKILDPEADVTEDDVTTLKKRSKVLVSFAERQLALSKAKTEAESAESQLKTILEAEPNA